MAGRAFGCSRETPQSDLEAARPLSMLSFGGERRESDAAEASTQSIAGAPGWTGTGGRQRGAGYRNVAGRADFERILSLRRAMADMMSDESPGSDDSDAPTPPMRNARGHRGDTEGDDSEAAEPARAPGKKPPVPDRARKRASSVLLTDIVTSLGFTIRDTLTPGSEGCVFVAEHPDYTRAVVVKAGRYSSTAAEAAFLRDLDHRNIPVLLDAHTTRGLTCLVLPRFRTDLYGFLGGRRRPPALKTVVSLSKQLLEALGYIHSRGIMHRDVKTENIFIGDHEDLYLGDFGAACRVWAPAGEARRYGLVGTIDINAPEMLAGDPYTTTVDIWGAGLVVFDISVPDASLFSSHEETNGSPSCERQIVRIIQQSQVCTAEFPEDPQSKLNKAYRSYAARSSRVAYTRPAWTRYYRIHADIEYFICRMLTFDGARRPSADELLRLPLFGRGGPVLGLAERTSRERT
ncbi:serine/threonine protein kinase US3 [Saimiriine alphaherpesvirus 1]|uniref:Serine/threonine protein kinase US3 n=1 Tax=Saimiriine herpesvirus 1 (strain MV-5-4-PSL) TaxID=10353 RepID=E2IUH5_SHV1|nr:serine/threonine protein kinase US3 [Saimiriine alphaherpesvirus 1]ADO13833.1 serine/threonine protein kinase US3 [Saimiriine alphaherpesvirus 1]